MSILILKNNRLQECDKNARFRGHFKRVKMHEVVFVRSTDFEMSSNF